MSDTHTYIQTDRQTDTTEIVYHATWWLVTNNQLVAAVIVAPMTHEGTGTE